MAETSIEWTRPPGFRGASWNPTKGCRRKSRGCEHCYAEQMAGRIVAMGGPAAAKYRLVVKHDESGKPQRRWNGKVIEDAEALAIPLRTKAPTCFFVDSMSDLFDPGVSDGYIAAVFGVMAACPQHRFIVLTKSADRMVAWHEWVHEFGALRSDTLRKLQTYAIHFGAPFEKRADVHAGGVDWPLPNVMQGVSVEDQESADERVPQLLKVPAAVRLLSCEPLLERVDLSPFMPLKLQPGHVWQDCVCEEIDPSDRPCIVCEAQTGIDWCIVGGESGRNARPFDLQWAREIIAQCRRASVPVFVKQIGKVVVGFDGNEYQRRDKGGDPEGWAEELRVREYPAACSSE